MAGGARLPNELKPQTKCAIWLNRERCYADWSAEPWSGVWQILQSLTSHVDVTKGVATAGTRLGERIGAVTCVLSTRANPSFGLIGRSGASPPYGVVKLRSEFLADFHVL